MKSSMKKKEKETSLAFHQHQKTLPIKTKMYQGEKEGQKDKKILRKVQEEQKIAQNYRT